MNDTKTDIFAYGMCVLEMITRQCPFNKEIGEPEAPEDELLARRKVWQAVRKGGYPYAFYLIETEVARNFIARCLAPHDQRPDADVLLKDPFLQPDPSLDDLEVVLANPISVPADIYEMEYEEIPTEVVLPPPAPCSAAEIEDLLLKFPNMEDTQKDVRLLEGRVDEDAEDNTQKPTIEGRGNNSPPPSQSKTPSRQQASPNSTSTPRNEKPKAQPLQATAKPLPSHPAPEKAPEPPTDRPVSPTGAEKVTVQLEMGGNLVVFDFEVGVDSYETVASEMKEQLHLKNLDTPELATMIEDYVQTHSPSSQDAVDAKATPAPVVVEPPTQSKGEADAKTPAQKHAQTQPETKPTRQSPKQTHTPEAPPAERNRAPAQGTII